MLLWRWRGCFLIMKEKCVFLLEIQVIINCDQLPSERGKRKQPSKKNTSANVPTTRINNNLLSHGFIVGNSSPQLRHLGFSLASPRWKDGKSSPHFGQRDFAHLTDTSSKMMANQICFKSNTCQRRTRAVMANKGRHLISKSYRTSIEFAYCKLQRIL